MEAPVEVFSHIPHFGDAVLAIVTALTDMHFFICYHCEWFSSRLNSAFHHFDFICSQSVIL